MLILDKWMLAGCKPPENVRKRLVSGVIEMKHWREMVIWNRCEFITLWCQKYCLWSSKDNPSAVFTMTKEIISRFKSQYWTPTLHQGPVNSDPSVLRGPSVRKSDRVRLDQLYNTLGSNLCIILFFCYFFVQLDIGGNNKIMQWFLFLSDLPSRPINLQNSLKDNIFKSSKGLPFIFCIELGGISGTIKIIRWFLFSFWYAPLSQSIILQDFLKCNILRTHRVRYTKFSNFIILVQYSHPIKRRFLK